MEHTAPSQSSSGLTIPGPALRVIGVPEILDRILVECSRASQEKWMWVNRYCRENAQRHFWRVVRNVRKFLNALSRFDTAKQVSVDVLTFGHHLSPLLDFCSCSDCGRVSSVQEDRVPCQTYPMG